MLCVFAQEYIKAHLENYQLEQTPITVYDTTITFDENGYLSELYKERKEGKYTAFTKISGTYKNNEYILQIMERNYHDHAEPDSDRVYVCKELENGWALYLNDKHIVDVCYSEADNTCFVDSYIDNDGRELFYRKKETYFVLNNTYKLINGYFQKLKTVSYEYYDINYESDTDTYSVKRSYEGMKTTYSFTGTYKAKNYKQICLLWILRSDILSILHPYIYSIHIPSYHASSYLTEGKITYEPEHLAQEDGLPWASANGKGIGEKIRIDVGRDADVSTLKIINGYAAPNHPDYYEKNSRVKKIKVTNTDTKKSKKLTVQDIKTEQTFDISALGNGRTFEVEILDVYGGSKYKDLCIQYLVFE